MRVQDKIYVDGRWVTPHGREWTDVVDATSEEVIGRVCAGDQRDVATAVAAAAAAFEGWAATPADERVALLDKVADGLRGRADELATLITAELGMPRRLASRIQVGLPIGTFESMAAVVKDFPWEQRHGSSLIVREPVGVVAAITPWNYPLHQIAAKLAPALAAGCPVILKPSEVAPLNAVALFEVLHEVGFPPGVVNLVSGLGPVVGEAMAAHPDVDMVSFTGSYRAGRRVSEVAAATIKRVALELGGKSANVLLDDLDGEALDRAVRDGVGKCMLNSGQTCNALTRMLVPRGSLAEVERLAVEALRRYEPGDPRDERTRLGPLVSAAQRDRVREYITAGQADGARLLTGGVAPPDGLDRGFFVRPTVFSDVDPSHRIAQEEIFGPVLVIIPYDDEDQAVRIANGTDYGLAAGVWSADPRRAQAVARRLRAGQVEVNGGAHNPTAPFGGYRRSGNGREFGRFGLEEFLEVKSMQL